ncbi:lactonase family protein [Actinacidiphila guanduensis]|uniref:6-phosphogluconolactonase, cycloisomerase 2 family n=1 Tax=Actinacidiphila guanduensis TaxID=310781 RepID=A0A1H0GLI0_9ACTN|nr:beta-propeller fold lactonase family protein [Actinacidiphila guanduensis]SDO07740.1 6-phosphogluconolactonase, cycloisomerase 2 family [Actinacidiphila guanduensis]
MSAIRRTRSRALGRTAGFGAAALACAALFAAAPAAHAAQPGDTAQGRAQHQGDRAFSDSTSTGPVFVQTDNPDGNAVVAYHRAADGTLTRDGIYPTGGKGGVLDGSVVDHLASQGSLAYDSRQGLLYAVNAGSDTVTVFAVHGDRLQRLQILGSGGSFPVSITFHGNLVYVLNALDGASVQGFVRVGDRLVTVPEWNRSPGIDPTATPQFTHTPGQISFTPDGTALVVTSKAAKGGAIGVTPLDSTGGPGGPTVFTPLPGAVPFGFVFDRAGRLQVTEAGPNAVATFTLGRDGKLTNTGELPTGQQATCWITAAGSHLYASNAGSGTLSGYATAGGALTPLGTTSTDAGTVDAAASPDGHFLYAQTGAAGIVDEFRVEGDGSLTAIGSVTVPGAVGGEGIAAG